MNTVWTIFIRFVFFVLFSLELQFEPFRERCTYVLEFLVCFVYVRVRFVLGVANSINNTYFYLLFVPPAFSSLSHSFPLLGLLVEREKDGEALSVKCDLSIELI